MFPEFMDFEEAVKSEKFSHCRFRPFHLSEHGGYVTAYHYAKESPSGFYSVAGHDNPKEADAICRKHGKATSLSPTETR